MSRKERPRTCRVLHEMYLNATQREKNMGGRQRRELLSRMKRSAAVQDHLLEILLTAS
jgi:hypothetical protein